MSPPPDRQLTAAELDLMTALWRLDGATARQVLRDLPDDPPRAYTTVATILRILEDKGFATSEKQGRALFYTPTIAREDYAARTVDHVVGRLFDGRAGALARHLVTDEALSSADLDDLARLIAARRKPAPKPWSPEED